MFRKISPLFSILALIALFTSVGAVEYDTPVVNKFGQVGLIYSHSAKTLGMGRLAIGVHGNLATDDQFVNEVFYIDSTGDTISPNGSFSKIRMSTLNFGLGYGLTRYLDFSVMLPLYVEYLEWMEFDGAGSDNPTFAGKNLSGIGDLELSLKWQYPPYPHRKFFEMAYHGGVSIPTGQRDNYKYFPRHAYYQTSQKDVLEAKAAGDLDKKYDIRNSYTSEGVEVDMKMLWTFDFLQLRNGAPVEFHVNYGIRFTPAYHENLFLLNAGLSYRPINFLTMFTEFSGETRLSNVDAGFKLGRDPLRVSPGISITPPGGLFLTFGADINIASTEEENDLIYFVPREDKEFVMRTNIEPRWKLVGALGWAGYVMPQDKDKDGIKDKDDRCPKQPEDFDGFEDGDGCPEVDNDKDGVADTTDKCPNDPEDTDGFEDEDGCPEYDNDKDGILDTEDKCPLVPEDLDSFEDEDGCPETDNDGDGIVDSLDHCINKAEDKDGFEDTDGCPEFDNDMDGVMDSVDQCPNKPETFNAFEDEDGCPDEKPVEPVKPKAKEIKRGRIILRGVNFESGKAILTGDSYLLLDQVYASLVEWPEVRIEIRGHTDSVGSRMSNKKLSYARAKSVREYLVQQGIAPERLTAVGMGEEEPIAENTTADGRAQNRRVEMHRID